MKGIVVDIDGRRAAAMSDDGQILPLPEGEYVLGQSVDLPQEMRAEEVREARRAGRGGRPALRRAAAAAAAAAVIAAGAGGYAYASPYGVVSLDVNPSIEYTINRFDRVLEVQSVGDEDGDLAEALDLTVLRHKTIDDAVSETLALLDDAAYFEGENNYVVLTAGTKDETHTAAVAQRMDSVAEAFNELKKEQAKAAEEQALLQVRSIPVTENAVEQAKEMETTAGKLWLVEQTVFTEEDAYDLEDIWEMIHLPVREIVDDYGGGFFPAVYSVPGDTDPWGPGRGRPPW